jgi:GR25 family glycosyltransferase involved in LPS biosynthesis
MKNDYSWLNNIFDEVYVINLERATERREFIEAEFEKYNVKFKFIKAVAGKDLKNIPAKLFETYKNCKFVTHRSSEIKRHQEEDALKGITKKYDQYDIGCELGALLSHLSIYTDMIKNDHSECLVLEDDMAFPEQFEDRFQEMQMNLPTDYNFVFLSGNPFRNLQQLKGNIHTADGVYALTGYIIKQETAKEITDKFDMNEPLPIDVWIDRNIHPRYLTIPHVINVRSTYSYILNEQVNYPFAERYK